MRSRTLGIAVAGVALTGTGLAVTSQNTGGPPQMTASRNLAAAPGPGAADRAAAAFVQAHHPGAGTPRVLATEPDTDRGVAVYDVRVLAPDKVVYVVHVRRSTDTVLWISRAENQAAGHTGSPDSADGSPDSSDRSPDSSDRSPDHGAAGSAMSSDRQRHQDG